MRRMMIATTIATTIAILAVAIPGGPKVEAARPAPIRLECVVRTTEATPVVDCDWSKPTSDAAVGVRLLRLDPDVDTQRRTIFRTDDIEVGSYTDVEVRVGHRYAYAVQAVNANGRVVGQSRASWVRIPGEGTGQAIEVLRLECELVPEHDVIVCEWRASLGPAESVITLWRSVDGRAREIVEQFRPTGPNIYRNPVPAGALEVTYAVVATSASGRIVGQSRPDTVRLIQATRTAEVVVP
jgi:hypothetical protein